MSTEARRGIGLFAAAAVAAAFCLLIGQVAAQTNRVETKQGRLAGKGVTIPLEHDDEGRVKSVVYAETATAMPDENGNITADGVRMVMARDAADTNLTTILVDTCKINTSNQTARSDSDVRLEQTGLTMTGTGLRWNSSRDHIRILHNVNVVIARSFVDQRSGPSSAPTSLPGFRKAGY